MDAAQTEEAGPVCILNPPSALLEKKKKKRRVSARPGSSNARNPSREEITLSRGYSESCRQSTIDSTRIRSQTGRPDSNVVEIDITTCLSRYLPLELSPMEMPLISSRIPMEIHQVFQDGRVHRSDPRSSGFRFCCARYGCSKPRLVAKEPIAAN
ncbi:hypothetical protein VTI28DRAFT_3100 [Corynascus sepedonium]